MVKKDYRPRLSVEISDDQYRDLQRLLPHGYKRQVFSLIIDDVIRLTQKHKERFIAAIMHKVITLEDYLSIDLEDKKDGDDK
uniref:Uncharacterized protein n=1 Tax=viral metagenome TaxID=1070528 RepID=A0A6H1ZVK5_9ZZZZ